MKKTIGAMLVIAGLTTAVFAQDVQLADAESSESKGFFGKITDGFATSTHAAHELSKESFEYASNIGAESWTSSREDTKERLSKGVWQGIVDEANKQKHNRKAFREAAINLHGTKEFRNAHREFSRSVPKYSFPGKE